MRTRIRKVGKEHIVIVPKRMLSAVGLKTGGPVEMTAHRGDYLSLRPSAPDALHRLWRARIQSK